MTYANFRKHFELFAIQILQPCLLIYFLQLQELGLQQPYCNDQGTYVYLRKLMALPFLPEQEIQPMFEQLRQQATTAPLQQFVAYVSDTWMWPPSSWSVTLKVGTTGCIVAPQAKICELWEDYQQNRRSAEQLLRQCAHLNGPKRSN